MDRQRRRRPGRTRPFPPPGPPITSPSERPRRRADSRGRFSAPATRAKPPFGRCTDFRCTTNLGVRYTNRDLSHQHQLRIPARRRPARADRVSLSGHEDIKARPLRHLRQALTDVALALRSGQQQPLDIESGSDLPQHPNAQQLLIDRIDHRDRIGRRRPLRSHRFRTQRLMTYHRYIPPHARAACSPPCLRLA